MLDLWKYIIRQSDLHKKVAAENTMKFKFVNRIICDVFFNNTQKLVNSQVRREVVQQFKER